MTPSTYLERLVERLTDSMDAMIRTSVVQFCRSRCHRSGATVRLAARRCIQFGSPAVFLNRRPVVLRPRLTPGVPLSPDQSGERNDSDAHGYPRVEPDIRVLFRADS